MSADSTSPARSPAASHAPLDLAEVAIFRAVAQEQSITRAAQQLGRVQSNVTTRVRQLEESLGVPLFLRDAKRMTLTDAGRQFLVYAEKLLALEEEARQSLRPGVPSGRLRIGSMESTAASRLPRPLAQYHAQWPEVSLALTTGASQPLIDAVLAQTLDCALIAAPGLLTDGHWQADALAGLAHQPVFTEDLMLVLPASHPPVTGPQDIRVPSLAVFARGCTYRDVALQWLEGGRDEHGQRVAVFDVDSYHAMLACVAAGNCGAVLPRSVLELARDPLPMRTHRLTRIDTWLVRRAGFRSAAFDAFLAALLDAQGLAPSPSAPSPSAPSPSAPSPFATPADPATERV
ncbi:LysR family transcriptional regulator [Pigmentiphaga aceris]|uniref:LysR family transcriptional regulator n=1 Tax=Pigmentiphaga aceris TaxID=1940612 RepID=A0A5C0AW63_9BURK|nr:LysR family transcriptional regulator [Pigmentiphaga aceris]QEI04567.1 LysR family transcriptional regulator [Pigmentiphaga aceris]